MNNDFFVVPLSDTGSTLDVEGTSIATIGFIYPTTASVGESYHGVEYVRLDDASEYEIVSVQGNDRRLPERLTSRRVE